MKEVVLQFPDLASLRSFAEKLKSQSYEIHEARRILACQCSEADVTLALTKFKAVIVPDFQ